MIDTFDRAAPMGTGSAKLAGNYAPTFKHAIAAKKVSTRDYLTDFDDFDFSLFSLFFLVTATAETLGVS